jgi:sugar phosphate permease
MLVGLAAAEFVNKKAASTSNGFAGCFANLGAMVAGYPLLKIADLWGWHEFIITLVVCSGAIALILLPIWSVTSTTLAEEKLEEAGETKDLAFFQRNKGSESSASI